MPKSKRSASPIARRMPMSGKPRKNISPRFKKPNERAPNMLMVFGSSTGRGDVTVGIDGRVVARESGRGSDEGGGGTGGSTLGAGAGAGAGAPGLPGGSVF